MKTKPEILRNPNKFFSADYFCTDSRNLHQNACVQLACNSRISIYRNTKSNVYGGFTQLSC
jgi:hypothetical protein